MKKFIFCFGISICMVVFSGCSKKSLTCVSKLDNDVLYMKQEYKLKFNKDSVKSLNVSITVKDKNSDVDVSDVILKSINDKFSGYYDESGVSYSTSEKSDGFDFNLKINFNKVNDSVKSKIDIINYTNNYDEMKYELEQEGFTCK